MSRLRPALRALAWGWALLRRMRTALWLLLAVASTSTLAAVIPQEPTAPDTIAHWRAGVSGPGPTTTALLDAAGLFDVFGSWWFLALAGLLMTSLVSCLVPRWRAHLRAQRRPPPPRPPAPLRRSHTLRTAAPPEKVLAGSLVLLRRRRFTARTVEATDSLDGRPHVAAERGRGQEAGSLVFHTAILLLLAGVLVSQLWGYTGQVDIVVGDTFTDAAVTYDRVRTGRFWGPGDHRGFAVRIEAFRTSDHPDGTPREFVADARISSRSGEERTVRLEVNHPASQDGMLVHLARHGLSPRVVVTDPDGPVRLDTNVQTVSTGPLASRGTVQDGTPGAPGSGVLHVVLLPEATVGSDGRPRAVGVGQDGGPVLLVDVHPGAVRDPVDPLLIDRGMPTAGATAVVPLGGSARLPDGATIAFPGLERWVGLQVTHTPGWPLLLAGALALLSGLVASLYVTRRRIWVSAEVTARGTRVTLAGMTRGRAEAFDAELARVVHQLRAQLPPAPAAGHAEAAHSSALTSG